MPCLTFFAFTTLSMFSNGLMMLSSFAFQPLYMTLMLVPFLYSILTWTPFLASRLPLASHGIPWHPIEKKGQDFASSVKYVGFLWDLEQRRVSLPDKKRVK